MTDDLVQRLRSNRPIPTLPHEAADRIEQLQREKAVVSDLWEQQKEIALGYLADCNKAAERIEALIAENERLRQPKALTVTVMSVQDGNPMHTFKIDPTKKTTVRPLHSMLGYVFEPEGSHADD